MKKLLFITGILFLAVFLNSCGLSTAFISTQNQNSTQVQLSNNNFKVLDKVSGSSSVKYIVYIGGLNKRQLYENAYSAMVNKANLTGGPRALINVLTEEHIGGVPPFYIVRTITVSANVIEFTK